MKKNQYVLNTILAVVVFVTVLALMLVRTFDPEAWLPKLDIPNMVLLSLVALLAEYLFIKGTQRCYVCVALFGVAAFGVLPLMAGFACVHDFWKYGLVGGVVFTVTTFLFTSATDRLLTGPKARGAVVLTGLGIYLAAQCFAGILL